jgi:Predicted hydrolases or acyltransferases (alpha/beta hydrolase superfamily)
MNDEFFFHEYGQGRPLVILHGWLGTSDYWLNVAMFLSSFGFRVFAVDLPNHARSFHTEEFSYEQMSDIMIGFCKAKGLQAPILMGHSMGGKIAMQMIQQEPEYFKAAVIVDIHFREYEMTPFFCQIQKLLLETDLKQFKDLSEFKSYFLKEGLDQSWVAVLMKNVHYSGNTLQWRSNIPLLAQNTQKMLGAIDVSTHSLPMLLIRGEKSSCVSQEDCQSFKEIYTNSRVDTIQGADHFVWVDNAPMFLKHATEFLTMIP